jgi:hypothetical protein
VRSLAVSFVIAALIICECSVFVFPAHSSLSVLYHTIIMLTIFALLSFAILLTLVRPNSRQAFAVGALTPIACLIFGNTEIFNLLGRVNYSIFNEIILAGSDQVTALIAGSVIVSLASGLLTLVFFEALLKAPEARIEDTAEPSDPPKSPVGPIFKS